MPLEFIAAEAQTPLQASKWLQIPVLLDPKEMHTLIEHLQPVQLFRLGCICKKEDLAVSCKGFLEAYCHYVDRLKAGGASQGKLSTLAWTRNPQALYAIRLKETNTVARAKEPVVYMQPHHLSYSSIDKQLRSMAYGKDIISWGVQFSYPQLHKLPASEKILTLKETKDALNTQLFQELKQWMRRHTLPASFCIGGKRKTVPIRLGKLCFPWVLTHPGLRKQEISIYAKD